MPTIDTVYRYRDLIDLHLYTTDVMSNRAFEYLWAFRAVPVYNDANMIDIMTQLEDNLEFQLFLERIIACTIAGYHMNVFINESQSYFVIGIMTKPVPMLEDDPPYGYFKLSQIPMTAILNSKYGHLTSLNTIDGRHHLFNINGMRSTVCRSLNACKDIAIQYYSSLFPLKDNDSLKNRTDEYQSKYNYHKLYEPDIDVDELKNEIRDPYPEEVTEFLLPMYEEGVSAAMEALGVCFAPGITNVNMKLLNFSTSHRYINRNSYIHECLLWGYNQFKIGKLSPWCFVGESILMNDEYEPVILNMITAIYSSLYDIVIPYRLEPSRTFGEQDPETGKIIEMVEMDITSIKYHLGLSSRYIPVKSATNAPINEYDQSYDLYADCVQVLAEDGVFVYDVIKTYERGEGKHRDTFYDTLIGVKRDNGDLYEVQCLVLLNQASTRRLMEQLIKDSVDLTFEAITDTINSRILAKLCDSGHFREDQKDDMILGCVGATADYGYICEVYLKSEKPPKEDIDILLPDECDDDEINFANIPPSPKPEIIEEKFSLWSFRDFFGRGKNKK